MALGSPSPRPRAFLLPSVHVNLSSAWLQRVSGTNGLDQRATTAPPRWVELRMCTAGKKSHATRSLQ
jgi:hypothetical protein